MTLKELIKKLRKAAKNNPEWGDLRLNIGLESRIGGCTHYGLEVGSIYHEDHLNVVFIDLKESE